MMEQVLLLLQEEIKEKQKPSGAWPGPGQVSGVSGKGGTSAG